MAPNIAQSGTAGRDVWYTGTMQGCPSSTGSFSFRVPVTGGCYDVEADHGHDCRAGSVRAAARRAGTCGHAGQRNDAHGPGDRPELSHHQRRDGPVSQRLRASVRQGRRATWHPGERRRSEEHTSELQSRLHLVCRLLLEKKNKYTMTSMYPGIIYLDST